MPVFVFGGKKYNIPEGDLGKYLIGDASAPMIEGELSDDALDDVAGGGPTANRCPAGGNNTSPKANRCPPRVTMSYRCPPRVK